MVVSSNLVAATSIPRFGMACFHSHMTPPGRQTSHITPNSIKETLSSSSGLSQELILKLPCDIIFPSLPGQFDIPHLTMTHFQLDY